MVERVCDVLVLGGGPAGAVAALTLARAGCATTLVDHDVAPAPFRFGESVPPGLEPLLRELGLWRGFVSDGHLPCYGNLSAWGAAHAAVRDFTADCGTHGWHLDRVRFDASLRCAAAEAGAAVHAGTPAATIRREEDGWRFCAAGSGGLRVRCRWIVDATGRRAAFARARGARRVGQDRLVAVAGAFQPAGRAPDRDSRTLVEASPDGWWYAALVPSGRRVVVYLSDADLLDRSVARSERAFLRHLASTAFVGATLEGTRAAMRGTLHVTRAGGSRLDRAVGDGWIAVGDAAVAFDPLASQGIFNALYTGMAGGRALADRLRGDRAPLGRYPDLVGSVYDAYCRRHAEFYTLEARWAERAFWRRRRMA